MKKILLALFISFGYLTIGSAYCPETNFYLKSFNGFNFLAETSDSLTKGHYKSGYMGALGAGYKIDCSIISRFEIEASGRHNDLDVITDYQGNKYYMKGNTQSLTPFVNAYFDFKNLSRFTPYIGLGAGYTFVRISIFTGTREIKGSNHGKAFQLIGGIKTALNNFLELGLEYRYFHARTHYCEQNLGATLTVNF